MDKIALISDIHGNLTALEAVLADIDARGIKKIYCLGDIIDGGPEHQKALDIVREKCEVILSGNVEHWVSHPELENREGYFKNHLLYIRNQLNEETQDYIKALPVTYEIYISGSLVRFMHAAPDSVYNRVFYIDDEYDKMRLFYPSENTQSDKIADVVIFADLHDQLMQKFFHKTLINIGSVGSNVEVLLDEKYNGCYEETTAATYCIIEGEIGEKSNKTELGIQFLRVPYDIEKEVKIAKDKNIEDLNEYINERRNGCYRNKERIAKVYKEVRKKQAERYMKQ